MLSFLAKSVTKYAKYCVAIWIILFITSVIFAIQLPNKLQGDGFNVKDDHDRVTKELAETFDLPANTIFILFENKTDAQIQSTLDKVAKQKGVQRVLSPLENPSLKKENYAYAMAHYGIEVVDFIPVIDELREIIDDQKGIALTGGPVISEDLNVASQMDLVKAELIGLPIALIVLLLAFGSIVAALLPIMIGVVALVTTLGIMAFLGDTISLSVFVLNIVPMLGLALSIDFALLFINRYKEEHAKHSIQEAIHITMKTAGRSIIFSALCVMIGLGALIVIRVEIFQNIALGGTLVVLFAVLTALTLLPAVLTLLGDRLYKGTLLKVKSSSARWRTFANFVIRHPLAIIATAFLLLVLAMVPIKDMTLTIPSTDALPPSYDARATYDQLNETFGVGDEALVYMLVKREGGWNNDEGRQLLFDLQDKLAQNTLVEEVQSIFTTAEVQNLEQWNYALQDPNIAAQLLELEDAYIQDEATYLTITLHAKGASTEAQSYVRKLKDEDLGVDFALAGQPKFNQEIFDEIANRIWLALAIILTTTFIILLLAFRSLLIPIKAILMNVIGLGSTFGILVYLFQYGHFGLEKGTIVLIIPVLVFCLVFGLSMDYEVFLISRIQEAYLNGLSNTEATVEGLVSTSKIISSAALIMIVLTGAFAFTDVIPVKQIGVGIAIAVAIDATIIRLMLVPSLMKLFGDWNWWLPFKRK